MKNTCFNVALKSLEWLLIFMLIVILDSPLNNLIQSDLCIYSQAWEQEVRIVVSDGISWNCPILESKVQIAPQTARLN